jgi:hypothetical protein
MTQYPSSLMQQQSHCGIDGSVDTQSWMGDVEFGKMFLNFCLDSSPHKYW